MGNPKDRAANRMKRRDGRKKNHDPLIQIAQHEEITRRPRKPNKRAIEPLNETQRQLDTAIAVNTIVFATGPAGTGKTWLEVMRACEALQKGETEKIIFTRPIVAAEEEDLGFLPGDETEKTDPYFRPVLDALEEFFGAGQLEYLIKNKVIEGRPMALLRGSTLKNAWVIADEMQNATKGQFKLLLSRIGENAKFLINGDVRQCDLPDASKSGLADAVKRLARIKGIGAVEFSREDIVRSGMCQAIVEAYEEPELTSCSPPEKRYSTTESEDAQSGLQRFLGS
jgi:phosphate starvation-inducible PhoH-like protein